MYKEREAEKYTQSCKWIKSNKMQLIRKCTLFFLLSSIFWILLVPGFPQEGSASDITGKKNHTGLWNNATSLVKKYYGTFVNSMNTDLWLSVLITFCVIFVACSVVYTFSYTISQFFLHLSKCCQKK
ncbi:uncharacterized protein LOC118191846 [Stegodyphus dumicola]|uniref:uncharacterized protein LOC118191846 n=1 Tax=Stegodyphus dumicola TaxID=202533 RepID=UPI0015AFC933|nr:uncharacterized protein LOC118191846 [Stegodyphus dumicola]